jgi:hypothetical protein
MRLFAKRTDSPTSRWGILRWTDIIINGDLYLSRLNLLKTPWFSVKLHWIILPDPDRDLHDHPWPFVSFVLSGGYKEIEAKDPANGPIVERVINWFNYKNTITSHRITVVQPNTITLIVTGPKIKGWGFYDKDSKEFKTEEEYEKVHHS